MTCIFFNPLCTGNLQTCSLSNSEDLNTFKQNVISYSYQLDQSIFVLRVAGWYFTFFIQILIEHSVSKQWGP